MKSVHILAGALALAAAVAIAPNKTALGDSVPVDPESPPPVSVTAVLDGDGDVASVVLIGRSGQLYRPQGSSSWKRDGVGGVSVDVGAAAVVGKQVFVAGERTPLFKQKKGVWYAHHLPNRGTMVVGVGGSAPVVGIRSHIYTIAQKRWKRMAATGKGSITAIWASTNKRVYVATSEGKLKRYNGKASNTITHPLGKDDTVVHLYGAPGKQLYGVSEAGVVLDIGAKKATAVSIPDDLAGLVVQAGGAQSDGTVWIAGLVGTDAPRPVLARLSRDTLSLVEELPAMAPGDRYTVVYPGSKGDLLMATAEGTVRVRAEDGTWTVGAVDGAPPESPEFADTAPARSK